MSDQKDFTLLEQPAPDTKEKDQEYFWCWFGVHAWTKWGKSEPHKTYGPNVDATKLDNYLPISIVYTQTRYCKGCNKVEQRKIGNHM